jgi:hypothetical protein
MLMLEKLLMTKKMPQLQLKDYDMITNSFCAATIDKVAGKGCEDATDSPENV